MSNSLLLANKFNGFLLAVKTALAISSDRINRRFIGGTERQGCFIP